LILILSYARHTVVSDSACLLLWPRQFDAAGDLYVGNNIALNIRAAVDGAVARIDGDGGLPYANISEILTTVVDPLGGEMTLMTVLFQPLPQQERRAM